MKTKDKELYKKIKNRICWDIRVSNSDIAMRIVDGRATLFGYFDKSYRHKAAIELITNTEGILAVNDKTQVLEDYERSDSEISSLISKQILMLPLTRGEWIDAEVFNGVVTLTGRVFRPRLKAFAARAAWELSGIKDCVNQIVINEPANTGKLGLSVALARDTSYLRQKIVA